jgi:hypothetical protein
MEYVYHYSDTARLPWILDAGELRPTSNSMSAYPDPDFLWASTRENGCASATLSNKKELYKNGIVDVVRFTLAAVDFKDWPDLAIDHPDWNALHIAALNKSGVEMGDDPRTWRCRIGSLKRCRWIAIHLRSYQYPRWIELPAKTVTRKDGNIRRAEMPGLGSFASQQFKNAAGIISYNIIRD